MTLVYVLVSNENDSYFEQTLISIRTLREKGNCHKVVVLVDQDTDKSFAGKRVFPKELNVDVCKIDVPAKYSNRDRSRYLKTSMYNYVEDDFLFIDGDTLICEVLPTESLSGNLAMVLDRHLPISQNCYQRFYWERAHALGWESGYEDKHFNSGVIFAKKCEQTKKLFNLWHKLWLDSLNSKQIVYDQTALNQANYVMGGVIDVLDGSWNCQVSRRSASMQFVDCAKILHYYASSGQSCYDLSDKTIQKSVLDEKHEALDAILRCPKRAFSSVLDFNTDINSLRMGRTAAYALLFGCYKRLYFVFRLLDKASGLILKFVGHR